MGKIWRPRASRAAMLRNAAAARFEFTYALSIGDRDAARRYLHRAIYYRGRAANWQGAA